MDTSILPSLFSFATVAVMFFAPESSRDDKEEIKVHRLMRRSILEISTG